MSMKDSVSFACVEGFQLKRNNENTFWVYLQELILTSTTRKNLKKILPAIQNNENLLLVGDAGTGKNSLIYYINYLRNQPTVRFSFNEDLLPEDLIGSYKLDPLTKNFIWQDGLLTESMKKGYTFVADEINLSNTDVLKRFQSVFSQRYLELVEGDNSLIFANDNFQFIATQNPVEGFEGRKSLPREIQKHFVTVWIDPYPESELMEILQKLYPDLSLEIIKLILDIHQEIENWVVNKKIGSRDLEKYHFNLRNLKRLCERISRDNQYLFDDLLDIYMKTFRDESDQKIIFDYIKSEIKKRGLMAEQTQRKIFVKDSEFYIGRNFYQKNSQNEIVNLFNNFPPVKERVENLDSILRAIQHNENILIECDSNTEPEEYIDFIGKLYSRKVKWIYLSKGMHTNDVLGSMKPRNDSIEWIDGPLTESIKKNYIIVISGLESAGAEIIEKLNMLLDEARTLVLPNESAIFLKDDAIIIGIKYFRKSKNQTTISRAFRNRFTSVVLKPIDDIQSIEEIIRQYLNLNSNSRIPSVLAMIHSIILNYSKEKIIGKDRSECYIFGLKNLFRALNNIKNSKEPHIESLIIHGFSYAYINEISDIFERNMILEEIKQILNQDGQYEFLNEMKSLKKKLQNEYSLKNNSYIDWNPAEHWRESDSVANWNREYKELEQGIDINTPETGGSIKEGKDAWYGADTKGNYGVGEPGYGGGAWGYRTEEIYQQFLKKRRGLNHYELGISLETFKEVFGKEIDSLVLQLDHLFDPEHFIHRKYDEKGTRIDIRKFISFQHGKSNSRIFEKISFEKEFKSLKEIEILFLINKGRRIFHFNYSVAILVAIISSAEILSNHQIPFSIMGYSDLENFKTKTDLIWYKSFDEEYTPEWEKKIFYGISNQWNGDTIKESSLIKKVSGFFSPDAKLKMMIIFSDFRGTRSKKDIEKEFKSAEFLDLKKTYELYKDQIVFLAVNLGSRNLGKYIFEHQINISSVNYYQLPKLMNEKLSFLIHHYYK